MKARLDQLETEVARLAAENKALVAAQAGQREAISALGLSLEQEEDARATAQEGLYALERQVDAIEAALSTPSGKKVKIDPSVQALQAEVRALAALVDAEREPAAPAPASEADERAASKLLADAHTASGAGDAQAAKALVAEVMERYSNTGAFSKATKLNTELSVVGKSVDELVVTRWFTTPATLKDKPLTLLIFWEVWCPHCKREVPAASVWPGKYSDLQVIGLTRLTRSTSPESVEAFIEENKLPFAVAQDTGRIATQFEVSGIPAAALVRADGRVVWRGHPARLTDEIVQRALSQP